MVNFNYRKWVTENKYGKLPEYREENPFDQEEDDPKNPMGLPGMEENITDRWKADMNSDSWLSKNVRPMILIFLVVSTVLMIFIDAGTIAFTVEEKWTDLLQLVLITVIGAYFGGRTMEKRKKTK